MSQQNAHHRGIRRAKYLLSTATIALFATGAGITATAAQDNQANDDDDFEEVVVTGSRIARDSNLAGSAPVSSVSAEDIQLSGQLNVADILRNVPSLLTSVSAESSVDSVFSSSVGQNVLQLRALGAERTLVLVDGRRHVSGVAGSQSVDVGSIPSALIERVEVLTGGASAVYGADAVTGVVNFILKDDFEGLAVNAQGGLSVDEGDGETYQVSATYGQNFDDDRGNFTVSAAYQKGQEILFGDRAFSRNNGIARDLPNPDANGPARIIRAQPTFAISSSLGLIAPGDFVGAGVDTDGNGIDDCQESSIGRGVGGIIGGCFVVDNGQVRPFRDGEIDPPGSGQFGGDGVPDNFDENFLIPDNEQYNVNLTARYQLNENINVFFEGKYVRQETEFGGPLNTFYDLLTVSSDNPFIPEALRDVANNSEIPGFLIPPSGITTGLFINKDPADLGPNISLNVRETYRFVGGIEGEFNNGWNYELSANYGRFEREFRDRNRVIVDRFFAAVDATTDSNGNAVCRSALNGTLPATTPFDIPLFDTGIFTFNPSQCVPINLFGRGAPSQEAIDFVTTTTSNNFTLEQFVISGFISGDTSDWFELPGGAVQFVLGGEYRDESSSSEFDPLIRGVCPVSTDVCNEGQLVSEIVDDNGDRLFRQNGLTFDPEIGVANEGGSFDVWDVFAEVSIPIINETLFFEELRLDASARYSDYSTVGSTFTWNTGLVWSPVQDISFRGSYAEAVRAPNVSELFDPTQGATFRPNDPCEQTAIDALAAAGDPNVNNRRQNCLADGIPVGFVDPLTARFVGETSGNPDLLEETAKTYTVGVIFQPRFIEGLTVSVDYFNIEIDDAISAVSQQDIVDNCYDSANFPNNQFCPLFTRNRDEASPTFLGFNFLRQVSLNFASLETAGIDFKARYNFAVDENLFSVGVSGSWFDKIDQFFDPGDPTAIDPELGEIQRPEWAATFDVNWTRGDLSVTWQTQYLDEMGLRGVEIETFETNFGPTGIQSDTFIHNLSASYKLNDNISLYGGINNIADKEPFITEQAYPVSPRGRFAFFGVNLSY